jgi:hypothetical protein
LNTASSVWKRVARGAENDCWPWLGHTRNGYGRLDIAGKQGVGAHRAAFESAHGCQVSSGLILHKCDNRACCNPQHLYLGDHAQNMADMRSRNRGHQYLNASGPRCKLTAEDVRQVRYLKSGGATLRAIALLYEVSRAAISGALYGRHYCDIT